ncbi:MAG: Lrp/AsnC family transcriptional regulator [Candidatus Aenigmarchaeota archaeon]|nr:Lrp/AsnC family transcriptional regulator [Candidatus Aenigmarchaeota archaeon]
MKKKTQEKSIILDEKDKEILNILQLNGREKLTSIAKKVGLSIDSVNNRIKKMLENHVFYPGIFVVPSTVGYPLTASVYIKLHNITDEEFDKFVSYLKNHPRVTSLISVMGDYDIICVLMTRNTNEMEEISRKIRLEFSNLIFDWKALFVVKVHKFEYYQL